MTPTNKEVDDKAPARIWLQWHGDADPEIEDGPVSVDDVSWCQDKIFEHDIEYVRAPIGSDLISREAAIRFVQALTRPVNPDTVIEGLRCLPSAPTGGAETRIALSGPCDNGAHSSCPYPPRCQCTCHVAPTTGARAEQARDIVNKYMGTVSEGEGDYSCNACEMDLYFCPHLYERLVGLIAEALSGDAVRGEGWQPIETAPKGIRSLLWRDNDLVGAGWFIADWGQYAEYNDPKFTHWQPLPAPPTERNDK